MTISAKLSDVGGVEFVVSEENDIDDVGGFSDPIQAVGAKTAKFSGGDTMQANSGKRIGLRQVKINTGAEILVGVRPQNVESNSGFNVTVGQPFTGGTSTSPGSVMVIDFESIDTQELTSETIAGFGGGGNSVTIKYERSDDNVSYTLLGEHTDDAFGTTIIDYGIQTWRYIRITHTVTTGAGGNPATALLTETVLQPPVNNVTVKVRSSLSIDTADGTILITDQVMTENSQLTFVNPYLLTGEPTGDFVTVEIVSQNGNNIPVTLSEITSIKEV